MAIPSSQLSHFINSYTEHILLLKALREHGLLNEKATDEVILKIMLNCEAETEMEIKEFGLTWASTDTRIAYQLSQGFLSQKGLEWLAVIASHE